jgi:hypothetical protein
LTIWSRRLKTKLAPHENVKVGEQPQHNALNSLHTVSKPLVKLFPELLLSPSKVQSLVITIFHQFQLILAHCKALNVWIATTSHPYLFHCEFAFDSLVQIAKSCTTRDITKLRAPILLISLFSCYFFFLFFYKFAKIGCFKVWIIDVELYKLLAFK